MTPAELAVERDWLLEHGRTAEEVTMMQAARELLIGLAAMAYEYGRDADIDEPAIFRAADDALWKASGRGVFEWRGVMLEEILKQRESAAASTPVQQEGRR